MRRWVPVSSEFHVIGGWTQVKSSRPTDWTFRPISSPYHLRTMIPTSPPSGAGYCTGRCPSTRSAGHSACPSKCCRARGDGWKKWEMVRQPFQLQKCVFHWFPLLDLGQYQWSQYWIVDARIWYISIPTKSICFHLFLGFELIRSAWFSLISGEKNNISRI